MAELPGFVERVVIFVITFFITIAISRLTGIYVGRYLHGKVKQSVYSPFIKLIQYCIYLLGFYIMVYHVMEFDIAANLTALGILGIAIFLPLVPILQNFSSGIFLSIERPFTEEDYILYNDEICRVKDMGMRRTILRSVNGKIISVPNIVFITGTPVVNYTKGKFIRIQRPLTIKNHSDLASAKKIILDVCTSNPNILPNIPQAKFNQLKKWLRMDDSKETRHRIEKLLPRIHIKSVSKDKIELDVWFWIWNIAYRDDAVSSFYQQILERFAQENIELG